MTAPFDPALWSGRRARLEEWEVYGDGLLGRVYGYEGKQDGQGVWTSDVRWMDESRTMALTDGTLYELGRPLRPIVITVVAVAADLEPV